MGLLQGNGELGPDWHLQFGDGQAPFGQGQHVGRGGGNYSTGDVHIQIPLVHSFYETLSYNDLSNLRNLADAIKHNPIIVVENVTQALDYVEQ